MPGIARPILAASTHRHTAPAQTHEHVQRSMSAPLTPLAVAFGGLHWGEFLPPLLGCLAYLTLYTKRARTLARERPPIPG